MLENRNRARIAFSAVSFTNAVTSSSFSTSRIFPDQLRSTSVICASVSRRQCLTQERAELSGGALAEGDEAQSRLLLLEEGKIAGECFRWFRRVHDLPIYSVMSMTSVDLMSAVTVSPTLRPISSTL